MSPQSAQHTSSVQRLARIALLSAVALVLSYIETMIPLPVALPGVKLGLANIAVVIALFAIDTRTAFWVALVKVLASGFLFGSPMMLAYSAGGTVLAFSVMVLLRLIPGVSVVVVSMASAIFHNVGQIAVACVMLQSPGVLFSLPPLAVAACITGALTGAVAAGVLSSVQVQGEGRPVVDVSGIELHPGQRVAFIGANGSGKTTAALQLAGLVGEAGPTPRAKQPAQPADQAESTAAATALATKTGIAFQDPDNQIVAALVRDDVAFGPENRGVAQDALLERVRAALQRAGAEDLLMRDVASLSGGQKQRVAIAGLLAMTPQVVAFDESTAMLDPQARASFNRLTAELAAEGLAVVAITQIPDEAFNADRIVVFNKARVVAQGAPSELLAQADHFEEWGIGLPRVAALAARLRSEGVDVPLTNSEPELEEALWHLCATE